MHSQDLYGLTLIAGWIAGIVYDRWLRKRGTHITGSIVDVQSEYHPRTPSGGGGTEYHAVLEFRTAAGWEVPAA